MGTRGRTELDSPKGGGGNGVGAPKRGERSFGFEKEGERGLGTRARTELEPPKGGTENGPLTLNGREKGYFLFGKLVRFVSLILLAT